MLPITLNKQENEKVRLLGKKRKSNNTSQKKFFHQERTVIWWRDEKVRANGSYFFFNWPIFEKVRLFRQKMKK